MPTIRVPVVVVEIRAFGLNLVPNLRLSLNASGCNERFLVLWSVRVCNSGSGTAPAFRIAVVAHANTTRDAPAEMSVFHFRDIGLSFMLLSWFFGPNPRIGSWANEAAGVRECRGDSKSFRASRRAGLEVKSESLRLSGG